MIHSWNISSTDAAVNNCTWCSHYRPFVVETTLWVMCTWSGLLGFEKKTNVYVCDHSFLLIEIRSRERHGIWNQRQASCLFNSVLKMPTIIKAPHNKPFVREIQQWRVDFPDKCLVMINVFIYHDVITVKGFVCIGVTTLLSCPETSFLQHVPWQWRFAWAHVDKSAASGHTSHHFTLHGRRLPMDYRIMKLLIDRMVRMIFFIYLA